MSMNSSKHNLFIDALRKNTGGFSSRKQGFVHKAGLLRKNLIQTR